MIDFLTFNFRTDTESYKSRELLLQNLYDKYGSDVDYEKLYREFQTVNEDIVTDIEPKVCEFGKLNKSGLLWTNADRYWLYVNKRNVSSMDIIKVYATPLDTTLLFDIYYGAVSLLSEGEHGFASKASKIQRLDPLCFWVEREDFFRLEEYLRQFDLERALPFIPYRGNIGISRETVESYNKSLSQLMALYFATRPLRVNLVDMYHLLLSMVNEQINAKFDTFFLTYPHTVVVLIKSMEIVVNETEITDDSMLLWDTYKLQHATDNLMIKGLSD